VVVGDGLDGFAVVFCYCADVYYVYDFVLVQGLPFHSIYRSIGERVGDKALLKMVKETKERLEKKWTKKLGKT